MSGTIYYKLNGFSDFKEYQRCNLFSNGLDAHKVFNELLNRANKKGFKVVNQIQGVCKLFLEDEKGTRVILGIAYREDDYMDFGNYKDDDEWLRNNK